MNEINILITTTDGELLEQVTVSAEDMEKYQVSTMLDIKEYIKHALLVVTANS